MKKTPALLMLCVFVPHAFGLFGVGDVVHDPVNYSFQVSHEVKAMAHWAEEIKRYQDMISNGVKQIEKAKELLDVQNRVREQVGDWKGVLDRAKAIQTSVEKLKERPSIELENIFKLDYGQEGYSSQASLSYTNNGAFRPLVTTNAFKQDVQIQKEDIARYAVLEKANENFKEVHKKTEESLIQAQGELAETYEDMARPGLSQADYTKLANKAAALQGRINQLTQMRRDAADMIMTQQAMLQAQAAKENDVKEEVQRSNHDALATGISNVRFGDLTWQ